LDFLQINRPNSSHGFQVCQGSENALRGAKTINGQLPQMYEPLTPIGAIREGSESVD
jgi:hypothetical protein